MALQRVLQARNPRLQLPTLPTSPKIQLVPALHQHLLHARHMQIIPLARRPVTPAPPFPPAPVTRRAHFSVQVKFHIAVVEHHGELRATRVQIEAAGVAVVEEAGDVFLAGVAVAGSVAGRAGKEAEGAFGVERVGDGGSREGAVDVEVEVADGALVAGPYSDLLAAVALEWNL